MNTTQINVGDLREDRELKSEELEQARGGQSPLVSVNSPIAEKYRPSPLGTWTREVVEDVEAY